VVGKGIKVERSESLKRLQWESLGALKSVGQLFFDFLTPQK
jgi:hypothetical protein